MTVTGSGGGKTHTATIRLIVSQAKDFRIDISPPTQTISQGQVTSYSLSIVGLNGFNSPVSLSLAGLPAGANYAFSIPSGTPDFSSVLTVTLPNNVQTGSFTLTVTGSGGGLNRVASAVLVITAAQTQTQTQTTTAKGGLLETLLQSNLLLIGIIIVVVLVALALLLRRRKPSYPLPPPKPCPTCGRSLMYVKQYDRWYCNSCKEYK
jgi:subtilase family serine protease